MGGIKRAERIFQVLLLLCAIASCSYAYIFNWWPFTTYGMIAGFILAAIIASPNWPWFNINPEGWHNAIDPEKEKRHFEKKEAKKKDKKERKDKKKSKKKKKSEETHVD